LTAEADLERHALEAEACQKMEEDLVECEAKVSQLSLINKIAADFVIINYFKPLRRHHIISIARQLKYTVAKDPIYLLIKSI